MRFRTTAILLIVATAIAAYILIAERGPAEGSAAAEPSATPLPAVVGLDPAAVQKVVIERPGTGERLALETSEAMWYVAEPRREEADQSKAIALVDSLSRLQAQRVLEGAGDGPAAYGLEPPALKVTLATSTESRVLLLGEQTVTGGGRYALVEGSEVVYVIANYVAQDVETYLATPPYKPTPTPEPTPTVESATPAPTPGAQPTGTR